MDISQLTGRTLYRDRDLIASAVADTVCRELQENRYTGEEADIDRSHLFTSARNDVTKLFMAVVSHRPRLFQEYVEWQRSVYSHRNTPSFVIRKQIDALQKTLQERLPNDQCAVLEPVFRAACDTLDCATGSALPDNGGNSLQTSAGQDLSRLYLADIVAGRSADAVKRVLAAAGRGTGVQELYLQVIQPAQQEIGRLWENGTLTIAEEHQATETARILMERLKEIYTTDLSILEKGIPVVIACPGGENHDMGARMVADFLLFAGYTAVFIGPRASYSTIIDTVRQNGARILAVSATMTSQIRMVLNLVDRVREELGTSVHVMVGGGAFNRNPAVWQEVGADSFAPTAEEAVRVLDAFLQGPSISTELRLPE
jgi:MerR family transcriptional regulator, light-induced transcriptional regulator